MNSVTIGLCSLGGMLILLSLWFVYQNRLWLRSTDSQSPNCEKEKYITLWDPEDQRRKVPIRVVIYRDVDETLEESCGELAHSSSLEVCLNKSPTVHDNNLGTEKKPEPAIEQQIEYQHIPERRKKRLVPLSRDANFNPPCIPPPMLPFSPPNSTKRAILTPYSPEAETEISPEATHFVPVEDSFPLAQFTMLEDENESDFHVEAIQDGVIEVETAPAETAQNSKKAVLLSPHLRPNIIQTQQPIRPRKHSLSDLGIDLEKAVNIHKYEIQQADSKQKKAFNLAQDQLVSSLLEDDDFGSPNSLTDLNEIHFSLQPLKLNESCNTADDDGGDVFNDNHPGALVTFAKNTHVRYHDGTESQEIVDMNGGKRKQWRHRVKQAKIRQRLRDYRISQQDKESIKCTINKNNNHPTTPSHS